MKIMPKEEIYMAEKDFWGSHQMAMMCGQTMRFEKDSKELNVDLGKGFFKTL